MNNISRPGDLRVENETQMLEWFQQLRDTRFNTRDRTVLRDYLILLHTPLVEHCARTMKASEPVEDLVQEGYIGLIKAVDRFNPAQGTRFSTYAYHLIMGEIRHYLRDSGKLIHEPGWHAELRQRVNRMQEQLTHKTGRAPLVDEIAKALQLSRETVQQVLDKQVLVVESLDHEAASKVEQEDGNKRWDSGWHEAVNHWAMPPESLVDSKLLVEALLPRLTELEGYVIKLFFYEERSKSEIARSLGISVNYVAYLVKRGINRLRTTLEAEAIQLKAGQIEK